MKMAPKRKNISLPKRVPSIIIPKREVVYTTPDKTTCVECPCFPKEDPYMRRKKLNPCQKTPLSLYELSAKVVDSLTLTEAFDWSVCDVARWLTEDVGLPQYEQCIHDNHINGRRLLLLEDPSKLPDINIRDFEHIKMITSEIRRLFGTELVKFARSLSLPGRKPLTICTIFKSKTGPSWGIRKNWTRSDILRWTKMIMPERDNLDHWDNIWHQRPDYPKIKFGRTKETSVITANYIPRYEAKPDICREYVTPRKFIIQKDIADDHQYIWMEHPEELEAKVPKPPKPWKSRLLPEKISLSGLSGERFILAKRKTPRQKFLP